MNFLKINHFSFLAILVLINMSNAENLIISSGDTVQLSGTHYFDIVSITNSSTLSVESDSGSLKIICDSLHIGGTSKIIANGVSLDTLFGGQSYQALAGGGAGAGFSGSGGDGGGTEISLGGTEYGNSFSFLKGSKGGTGHSIYDGISNGNHEGGSGGGAIWLEARVSNIFGKILANGHDGIQYDSYGSWPSGDDWGGSGGGSGGQIYIESPVINFGDLTLISAKGGNGGSPLQGSNEDNTNPGGGGGGSGGRITIINESNINPDHFNLNGGTGGTNSDPDSFDGLNGAQGILNHIKIWLFSDTHPNNTLYYLNNEPEFKLINEDDFVGYFYELDTLENTQVDLSSDYIVSDGEETIFSPGKLDDGVYYLHVIPYDGGESSLDSLALSKQIKIGTNSVIINSSTHPNSDEWYEGQNVAVSLDYPYGVTKFYYEFDQSPFTVPVPDSSLLAENSSWIMPGLENGIYFMHIIPQDSIGFNRKEPIRKRFNVGQTYPFTAFSQNYTNSDTLVFSYQTINSPIQFSWNSTSLIEGQWYSYGIDFFNDLDSVFSVDIISGDSLSIHYDALDIYQYISEINEDTLSGHWWVKTMNPYGDTLMSSNGPMPFTIIRDSTLTTYSNFSLNTPLQNSNFIINQETLNDTILFSWDPCENIYGDTITYHVDYASSFGSLLKDTLLFEPSLNQSLLDIYLAMLDLNIASVEGDWRVTAINGVDTIESNSEPFNISISIDSDEIIPLAPFVLKSPSDSTELNIDSENLLDTLSLDWGSSFNINGLESSYLLSYQYDNDSLNTDLLLQDTTLNESKIYFDHIQLFNLMNAAEIDTLSFSWQVKVEDASNELNSLNGPFQLTISKDNMDIERPIVSIEVESSLISYSSDIEINSTFIYNDTLTYFIDYSLDGGIQWENQANFDSLSSRINITYDWNVFEEIGWNYLDNVNLRFYANNGTISSDTIVIDSLIIANIAGDYIYEPESELGIQANDISKLLSIFYDQNDTLGYYDIGPSSGVAPSIISDPDNIINFEDLSTFTQMWYWSNDYFSPITEIEMENANINQNYHFEINKESSPENTILSNYQLNFKSSDDELRGLDLVLKYDPNLMNLKSVYIGDVFDEKFLRLESLDKAKGKYVLSLWSKDDLLFNVEGNWLNLTFESIQDENIFPKVDLYIEPHKLINEKERVQHYALDIKLDNPLPENFFLSQNYPNPFNPTTKIDYGVPEQSHVDLIIYDITGRQVKVIINQIEIPGFKTVEWNGLDKNGNKLGTGIYFYRLAIRDKTQTRKMIYMK